MDDERIIELYWRRDERAVAETGRKYGAYCHAVSMNILGVREDAEECVNDTSVRAWNAIPPQHPKRLQAWLARITRNLSIDRYNRNHAQRRGGGSITALLSELDECVPTSASVESAVDERLEFTLTLWPSGEGYSLLGKTVCVRFVNLGIACKVSTTPVVFGEWVFEIELPSESGARECFLNKPMGDTGFAINEVTISPLSVCVAYSTPADVQIKGDELGIPMFEGVILKDGTRLENIFGSGGEGYSADTQNTAYTKSGLTQVIDPNEVTTLLFYRSAGDKQTAIEVPLS